MMTLTRSFRAGWLIPFLLTVLAGNTATGQTPATQTADSADGSRLARQISALTVSPTLRGAAGAGAQSSPDPAVYLVAAKDGTVVRARAGVFLSPGIFIDATLSSTVTGTRGSAISETGLTPGTSVAGRVQWLGKKYCSQNQAPVSCADHAAFVTAAQSLKKRVAALPARVQQRAMARDFAAEINADGKPWVKRALIVTGAFEETYKKTRYFEKAATAGLESEHWAKTPSVALGIVGQRKKPKDVIEPQFYVGGSVAYARDITAPSQASFCYPVPGSIATQCETLFSSPPLPIDGSVVKMEGRYWINNSIAAAAEYSRNSALDSWNLTLPVQLFTSKKSIDDPLGDAGGTATGGIAFEWKTKGGTTAFAVFAYLGTAFQLPQLR